MARLKRGAVVFQGDFDDAANVRAVDADALLRLLQRALQAVLFFLQTRDAPVRLVAEFALGELDAVGCRFGDAFGELGGFVAPDAVAGEGPLHPHAKDFAGRAELPADDLGLADERVQHAVLFALVVDEIAAGDDPGGLQLAIDAAVALFEPRRVPGQIEVDEVVAAGLKVQALARGVGADEDPDGLLVEGRVEGDLDAVALLEARLAGEDEDSSRSGRRGRRCAGEGPPSAARRAIDACRPIR